MFRILITLLVLSCVVSGCSYKINTLNPKPNINIDENQNAISILFSDKVIDSYSFPSKNGIGGATVEGWHQTLTNGFNNGFSDSFQIENENPDLTLKITRAEIEFSPTAVTHAGQVATFNAHIVFKASLYNQSEKKIINRTSGTAVSKLSTSGITGTAKDLNNSISSAVESMYEIIASKML